VRALIIEDEPVAARNLARQLGEIAPDIETLPPLATVRATVEWLAGNDPPDLMFVDVQLADGLSFEIFETIPVEAPVVFVTAYDEYAMRAFDANGVDYLLKPIDPKRLARAIDKCRALGNRAMPPAESLGQSYREAAHQHKQRFLVHSGASIASIDVSKIAYFSKELVTRLVTIDEHAFSMSQSLDALESMLDPYLFFRINRQLIAHIQSVRKAHRLFKGKLEVELHPPTACDVTVSQERATLFRGWLDR